MEICRERNIAIEVCPLSNELLRYTTCIATHPVKILLNSDVPLTLSCDDPQFFGNQGLSYDLYSLLNSSEKMDIVGLGRLARKSIKVRSRIRLQSTQSLSTLRHLVRTLY